MSNRAAGNRISGNNKLRKIPILWRRVICILCVAIVIGAVLSVVTFFVRRSPAKESVTLQMSFDGAADGIAPNGYRFDISEMLSDTVLKNALVASSLDQRYSTDEIRKCVVIAGRYPEDIVGQTMSYDSLLDFTANRQLTIDKFHPTQFTITLSDSTEEKMSKKEMETLLSNIVEEYKKYFSQVAVMGKPSESSVLDLSDYDYAQQLEIIEQRIQIMIDYATELYNGEPSFRNNGNGFNDIAVRLNNLIVNDISRINAKLTLNALTKDSERLLTQYRYELRNINNRLTANENVLKLIDNMVEAYEKAEILYISTQEALTKIDGNSSETYDKLIATRKSIADGNTKLVTRKEDILLKLQDLLGGVNGSSSIGGAFLRFDEDDMTGTDNVTGQGDGNQGESGNAGDDGNDSGSANNNENNSKGGSGANDPINWTDAQIVAALQKAATNSAEQREALEQEIALLVSRCDAIAVDFREMLQAWNSQKINDLTLEVGEYKYIHQGILSGAFIRNGIKTTGPFIALAVIISLIMIIVANVKAEKAEQRAARLGKRNRKNVARNDEYAPAREEQIREQAVSVETEQDTVLWNIEEPVQASQYEQAAVREATVSEEERAARIAARRAAETPEERAARIAARRAAETEEERAARIAARRAAETPEERAARRARRAAKLAAERAAAENAGSNNPDNTL